MGNGSQVHSTWLLAHAWHGDMPAAMCGSPSVADEPPPRVTFLPDPRRACVDDPRQACRLWLEGDEVVSRVDERGGGGAERDAVGWRMPKELRCDKDRPSDRFVAYEVDATQVHDAA